MTAHAQQLWEVFLLFAIPIGGGIPAGVLLAKSYSLAWPVMVVLYFLSDLALACVFEPVMRILLHVGKRSAGLMRFKDALKESMRRTTAAYGTQLGPLALIGISFGVDPMTGRALAAAAGHGFVVGWMVAIAGDMIYFAVLMVSTLWLNGILGNGTWTTIIILVAMLVVPILIRRVRNYFK